MAKEISLEEWKNMFKGKVEEIKPVGKLSKFVVKPPRNVVTKPMPMTAARGQPTLHKYGYKPATTTIQSNAYTKSWNQYQTQRLAKQQDYDDYSEYASSQEYTDFSQSQKDDDIIEIPKIMFQLDKDSIEAFETANMNENGESDFKYIQEMHMPGVKVSAFDYGHYLKNMKNAFEQVRAIAGKEFSEAFDKEYDEVWKWLTMWFKDKKLDIDISLANDFESSGIGSQA